MNKIFWLCSLIEGPHADMWHPAITSIVANDGTNAVFWSTTDALRSVKYAAGAANLDDAHLALVQADNTIHVIVEPEWFTQFDQLAATRKNRIRTFLTNAGIALPANNEVLRDLWNRIVQGIDNKTIEELLNSLTNP